MNMNCTLHREGGCGIGPLGPCRPPPRGGTSHPSRVIDSGMINTGVTMDTKAMKAMKTMHMGDIVKAMEFGIVKAMKAMEAMNTS